MAQTITVPILGDEHRHARWTDRNGDSWRYYSDNRGHGWQYLNHADPYARWTYGTMHIADCGPFIMVEPIPDGPPIIPGIDFHITPIDIGPYSRIVTWTELERQDVWHVEPDQFDNGRPSFDVIDAEGNEVAYFLREADAIEYRDWKAGRH